MLPSNPIKLTALVLWAMVGSGFAQQPSKTKKPVPPPHPTIQHYRGTAPTPASKTKKPAKSARTSSPGYRRPTTGSVPKHTWKKDIVTTVFWVGEKPSPRNPTTNVKSAWDTKWQTNFGGYDNPSKSQRTYDFCAKGFTPKQNPFYCALPYNDVASWNRTKTEARMVIPWFRTYFKRHGRTVCKGRWIAIHHKGKTCFAQWEDVGPFRTDDWSYVFGNSKPANLHNGGAGLDVSPAVRDFLGMQSGDRCHWRFAELYEVRPGPWKKFGSNNHFVVKQQREREIEQAEMERLRKLRDDYLRGRR